MRLVLLASLGVMVTCTACEPAQSPDADVARADGGDANPGARAPGRARAHAADSGAETGEHPFAGSTAEATSFISTAVDKRQSEIGSCIREFRVRKKMTHDRVAISFGIDQEGRLLGVTSKGKEDADLQSCIQEALRGAAFPRSHSGVITVTKTYEELVL